MSPKYKIVDHDANIKYIWGSYNIKQWHMIEVACQYVISVIVIYIYLMGTTWVGLLRDTNKVILPYSMSDGGICFCFYTTVVFHINYNIWERISEGTHPAAKQVSLEQHHKVPDMTS